jgi:hypothetical protein
MDRFADLVPAMAALAHGGILCHTKQSQLRCPSPFFGVQTQCRLIAIPLYPIRNESDQPFPSYVGLARISSPVDSLKTDPNKLSGIAIREVYTGTDSRELSKARLVDHVHPIRAGLYALISYTLLTPTSEHPINNTSPQLVSSPLCTRDILGRDQ